jgi:hypothetical protein
VLIVIQKVEGRGGVKAWCFRLPWAFASVSQNTGLLGGLGYMGELIQATEEQVVSDVGAGSRSLVLQLLCWPIAPKNFPLIVTLSSPKLRRARCLGGTAGDSGDRNRKLSPARC